MYQTQVTKNGLVRIPDAAQEALKIYAGAQVTVEVRDDELVIKKIAMADDPFAAAARGPDVSRLDEIQQQQKQSKQDARDKFEKLMENPPEVKPEDNPDLWR